MRKSGFAWHCHHDVLMEYVVDYDERAKYIQENKPKNELELRLRLFQMVTGPLSPALDTARAALDTAIRDNMPALLALHAQECPNCPWDGKTIFSEVRQ